MTSQTKHEKLKLAGVIVLDAVLINLAFIISYIIRYRWDVPYPVDARYDAPFYPYIPFAFILTVFCLITYRLNGLYDNRRGRRWLDEIYPLFSGTTASILIVMAITFSIQPLVYSRGVLVLAGFIIVAFLSLARMVRLEIAAGLRRRGIGVEQVLIVGAGEVGRAVMRSILADPVLGYQVLGYVDDDPHKGDGSLGRFKGLGGLDKLREVVDSEQVDEVIITLPWMYHRKIVQIIDECEQKNIRVRVVPDMFQQRMRSVDLLTLSGIPLIGVKPSHLSSSALLAKRIVELMLCIIALPFLIVVFALIALAIRLDSPGPAIFKHRRVGKDGREFEMYKFRSMVDKADEMKGELRDLNEADGPLFKIKDDPRTTRLGRFLRRTSIDELPQVINILRGEMSIVGPRPGTPEEVAQYEPWQRTRIAASPGLTGLWQVSGRSDIPFDEMCLLDIYYIENWSLGLDIRIMLQTIPHILFGRGAY
ncbi:MAG: sugar transferase [Anaerolineae bacterium]|nr:sugar transferase [Anaerolineae bacterium]